MDRPQDSPSTPQRREIYDNELRFFTALLNFRTVLFAAIVLFVLFKIFGGNGRLLRKDDGASSNFIAGVRINEPIIKTYEVSGANFFELNESMLKNGPFDSASNRRWWGMTHWNIDWKFLYATDSGQCRLDKFALTLNGVIDLPEFANREFAAEEVKTKWDSFRSALRTHENGHWRTGIDATNELEKRLLQISPKQDCQMLNQEIEAIGTQVTQEYREVDKQYDLSTNHGVNQGATF